MFLRWEDIVSRAWVCSPLALGWRTVAAYAGYARHLDWGNYWRLGKGPFVTTLYPLIITLLLPLLFGLPFALALLLFLPAFAALPIGLAIGIVPARPVLEKIRAFWLIRLFIFNDALARDGYDADLDARLDDFTREVSAALDEDLDEVLLVAHSNGSILAVPLLLRLIALRGGKLPEHFAMVTLGHCIPLLACRRDAGWYREELHALSTHDFRWYDFGSPPDGAAYHAVDPMRIVAPTSQVRLEMYSPRFHLFYDPATYHAGWANKYEIHFDYLRSGDRVSPVDYPSLTASDRLISQSVALFRELP